jgi:hypothetical protein
MVAFPLCVCLFLLMVDGFLWLVSDFDNQILHKNLHHLNSPYFPSAYNRFDYISDIQQLVTRAMTSRRIGQRPHVATFPMRSMSALRARLSYSLRSLTVLFESISTKTERFVSRGIEVGIVTVTGNARAP